MRWSVLSLPALAVLAAALVAGEDRKEKRGPDRPRPADKSAAGKPSYAFDVEAFIRDYDRNKDGYLSKDELPERFRHNFDKLDTNKDGKLSAEELRKGEVYLHPRRRPSDVVFVLVEMSEGDDSCVGELQTIYDFLRRLDSNKDGKIHADELKAARVELIKRRVNAIFRELDTDKDGKISREEAKGRIKRYFDELDSNKDGFVDHGELSRAAAEKPGELPPRTGTRLPRGKSATPPKPR